MSTIGAALKVLGETLGLINKQTELNNTPEMIETKKKSRKQRRREELLKVIEEKKLDDIRKELS